MIEPQTLAEPSTMTHRRTLSELQQRKPYPPPALRHDWAARPGWQLNATEMLQASPEQLTNARGYLALAIDRRMKHARRTRQGEETEEQMFQDACWTMEDWILAILIRSAELGVSRPSCIPMSWTLRPRKP